MKATYTRTDLGAVDLTRADIRGADLTGADRRTGDPPIPGWAVVDGQLAQEVA